MTQKHLSRADGSYIKFKAKQEIDKYVRYTVRSFEKLLDRGVITQEEFEGRKIVLEERRDKMIDRLEFELEKFIFEVEHEYKYRIKS